MITTQELEALIAEHQAQHGESDVLTIDLFREVERSELEQALNGLQGWDHKINTCPCWGIFVVNLERKHD